MKNKILLFFLLFFAVNLYAQNMPQPLINQDIYPSSIFDANYNNDLFRNRFTKVKTGGDTVVWFVDTYGVRALMLQGGNRGDSAGIVNVASPIKGNGAILTPVTFINGTVAGQVWAWNGSAWVLTAPSNIYSANGTLAADRTVTGGNKDLTFSGVKILRINTDASFIVTDGAPTKKGIQYAADYCPQLQANDRSLPDVACVRSMIGDSLPTILNTQTWHGNSSNKAVADYQIRNDGTKISIGGNLLSNYECTTYGDIRSIGKGFFGSAVGRQNTLATLATNDSVGSSSQIYFANKFNAPTGDLDLWLYSRHAGSQAAEHWFNSGAESIWNFGIGDGNNSLQLSKNFSGRVDDVPTLTFVGDGNAPGQVGFGGVIAPQGQIHCAPSVDENPLSAPLVFSDGSLMDDILEGAFEFMGSNLYFTDGNGVRMKFIRGFSGFKTLDFPATLTGAFASLNTTVTGAANGDCVTIGVPSGSAQDGVFYQGVVTAANTVRITMFNQSGIGANPPLSNYQVTCTRN